MIGHAQKQAPIAHHRRGTPHCLQTRLGQLLMGLGAGLEQHEFAAFFLQCDQLAINDKRRGNGALPFLSPFNFAMFSSFASL